MNIRKHTSVILGLVLACGFVSCFNDTAFDIIKMPHMLDTLLYKLEPPSGAALWAKTVVSGSDESTFNSVAAGSDGVYAAGYIKDTGNYEFNNGTIAKGTSTAHNVVLVKYDFNGKAQWAKTVVSGTPASAFNAVAVGSDGIYAAGKINNTTLFNFGDSQTVAGTCSGANPNIVLVKYDFDGTTQWAKSLYAGTTASEFNSVAVGSDGVYAAGYIIGTTTFDFGTSTNHQTATGLNSGKNIVLVKYDFGGNAQWAKTVSLGPNASEYNSVAVGSDGVYAAGYIIGTSEFDFPTSTTPKTVTGPDSGANIVIVKYDFTGNALWAKTDTITMTSGTSYPSQFNSVAVGSDGIYAAGSIFGQSLYNFGPSTAHGGYLNGKNTLLVKYNSTDGSAKWARAVSNGPNESELKSVSVGSNGVYVAGYITGYATFDFGNNITATGATYIKNIIVMEYGIYGLPHWATTVSDGSFSNFLSVSAGSDGVYTAGWIFSDARFDFGNYITVAGSYTGYNVVLAKYKP